MTAVVTGGASGMGESMVYALAKEGASIVVVDRNVDGASMYLNLNGDFIESQAFA